MKNNKICRVIKYTLCAFGGVLLVTLAAVVCLVVKDPNPDRPAMIDHPNGFVQAVGTNLYDGDGNLLTLRGVNLGNWFLPENYMAVASVDGTCSMKFTQQSAWDAMRANPNLTDEQIKELYHLYMRTYITEEDFRVIASLGLNTVRIPFTWRNVAAEEGELLENGVAWLDWALEMCDKYGLYAVLDLHGAYGSQNMDQHSGDATQFHLYDSEENMRKTCDLWARLAERYRGRRCVAGYVLNECRRAPGKFGGRINTDFYDRLYKTVRAADPDHMIFIEYFSFPFNGGRIADYGWENVCLEYHIYNLSPFSQRTCILFYKAAHNLTGNKAPVYVGEWNAFADPKDWRVSLDLFDELGWSWSSWTYKANGWFYNNEENWNNAHPRLDTWGVYELDLEPVDLATATYDEIAEVYRRTATEYAAPSLVYEVYRERFAAP